MTASSGYEIKRQQMNGSVWKVGELITGVEKDGSLYCLVQVKERVVGPRGGIREPAEVATITATTERGIATGLRSLGFTVPRSFHVS